MEHRSRDIEKIFLYVYTFFSFFLFVATIYLERSLVVIPPLIIGVCAGWYLCVNKYGTYRLRVYVLSIGAMLGLVMYGMAAESFLDTLSPFVVLIIMVGMFEDGKVLFLMSLSSVFLMFYHGFFLKSFNVTKPEEWMQVLLQIMSISVVVYMTWQSMNNSINMKRKLLETIDELQQTEHSKDEFMANVSHELRTPLNTIRGMSELILREDLPVQVREEAFHIQMAGRNLQTIVSDVLDYSELQTGEFSLDESYYNFSSILNDVLNVAIAQNEDKHLELIVNCDPTIPRSMVGDSEKIARVLYSIVNNAIKFTEKGCVVITATTRKEYYGVNLCVTVKDTGIGMTPEQKERLFTSFNQVDTKKNRTQGGIGLGLAISRKMLELMKGFLMVRTEPGKGSEFDIIIPQRVEDKRPMISVKEDVRMIYYINQEKYSMVEIRDAYRKTIRDMAENLGVTRTRCRSLKEFKERVEKGRYTHALISIDEYREAPEFFEELSKKIPVLLVLERHNDKEAGSNFLRVYKPFYALSVANALNGGKVIQRMDGTHYQPHEFIAPDANVLVVDDNMMNLKVMEGLLRPYEVRLLTATGGDEALKLLDQMHCDLIFMDHMMPKMDGVETLHAIRAKAGKYYHEVPIVALTANAMGGAREMFLSEGFQDFVPKPVEMSHLERTLKRYLPAEKIVLRQLDGSWGEEARIVIPEAEVPVEGIKENASRINEERGIQYCGGQLSDYLEVIEAYHWDGQQKKQKIQKFYEEKSWKDYTILVHSLKSTSQAIGANHLFELARDMEQAGKEEDCKTIAAHHEEMMQEFDAVLAELGERLEREQKQSKRTESETSQRVYLEIEAAQLEEEFKKLEQALDDYNGEQAESLVEELKKYRYKDKILEGLLTPVAQKIDDFDFGAAMELLQKVREEVR